LQAGPVAETWFRQFRGELNASWRHHLASDGVDDVSRAAPEVGARIERQGAVLVAAAGRVLRVSEGTYGVAGVDVALTAGPLRFAGAVERWISSDVQDVGWSVYVSTPVRGIEVWTGLRHDARDPLYWNPARRTWNAGFSIPLNRPRPGPLSSVVQQDGARLRVARMVAEGQLYIAGDFTNWQPQPMSEAGDSWEYVVRLGPGVYHYAYVDAAGRWFVPEETAGRMDDGMGGHVAALVVR
jgi:hypothetical protein